MDEATKAALQKLATGYTYEDRTVVADSGGKAQRVTISKKQVPLIYLDDDAAREVPEQPSLEAIKMIEKLKLAGKW